MSAAPHAAEPAMTVLVLAYNHAPYIRECLDSMLRQVTTFPFEICIGEDDSPDGTRAICREYAERFPDRIRLILHARSAPGREAYCSQGNYNYVETLGHCRGKYIADCDGDDFWTDPAKLQKQYDLLERNPSVNLVHSDYDVVDSRSVPRTRAFYASGGRRHEVPGNRAAFLLDVLNNAYPIRTCTVVMRASAVRDALAVCGEDLKRVPMADVPLWCEVLRTGDAAFIPESLAAYRALEESACNSNTPLTKARFVNRAADWGVIFGRRNALPMEPILRHKIRTANRYAFLSGDPSEIRQLHAGHAGLFPRSEQLLFRLACIPAARPLLRAHYLRTYRKTQRRLSRPTQ